MKKILTLAIGVSIALFSNAQNYTITSGSGIDAQFDNELNSPSSNPILVLTGTQHNVLSNSITLPFAWKFYGQPVTSYKVSTSGFITFNTASTANDTTNTTLPTTGGPNNAIYAFWDNLELRPQGTADEIYAITYGTAPQRHHIIFWRSVSHRDQVAAQNMYFALRISECGDFEVARVGGSGVAGVTSATVGCENFDGSVGAMVAGSPNLVFADDDGSDLSLFVTHKFKWDAIAYDVAIKEISSETMTLEGSVPVGGLVENMGNTTITSMEVTYKIDNGSPVTQTLTGLTIAPGDEYSFFHPTFWNATEGVHKIELSIGNLNGSYADERNCNNTSSLSTYVVNNNNAVKKTPLFEILTGSTCPPCRPGNINFHDVVDTKNEKDYVQVKYQQDFPGTGDPYATAESVGRRDYYGVSSIPTMLIDGGWYQSAADFTENDYTTYTSKKTFISLLGTYSMDTFDKIMNIKVRYTPLIDLTALTSAKLHIAIVETITKKNKKSNGETEFYHVMKKMIGNENGLALSNLVPNVSVDLDTSFTFMGKYRLPANGQAANHIKHATENSVENFSNLRVAAWIQVNDPGFPESKYVIQAYNLTDLSEGGVGIKTTELDQNNFTIYPNPANEFATLRYNLAKETAMEIKLMDLTGKVVFQSTKMTKNAGEHENIIHTDRLANGIYNMVLNVDGKIITKKLVVANQ